VANLICLAVACPTNELGLVGAGNSYDSCMARLMPDIEKADAANLSLCEQYKPSPGPAGPEGPEG
jgi:hypothetical protein